MYVYGSGSASLVVKTVNQGNLGFYRVIGVVVFSWKGDHGMRVWMYGCGNGGGHDRSGCVGHDVVMSGDCAYFPPPWNCFPADASPVAVAT